MGFKIVFLILLRAMHYGDFKQAMHYVRKYYYKM